MLTPRPLDPATASASSHRSRRRGFSLVEILTVLIIIGLLSAVTIPTVMGRLKAAHVTALSQELETLQTAISNYRSHVGRYPNRLKYLTLLPSSGVTDLCGTAYTAANYAGWRGPYVNRTITTYYLVADADTVDNIVSRSPATVSAGVNNYLQILVEGVDQKMATDVQAQLDGDGNFGAGTIQWVVVSGSYGTLTYSIPIAGNGTSGC